MLSGQKGNKMRLHWGLVYSRLSKSVRWPVIILVLLVVLFHLCWLMELWFFTAFEVPAGLPKEPFIIVTSLNFEFLDFFLNWFQSIKNLRPENLSLVVYAEDDKVFLELETLRETNMYAMHPVFQSMTVKRGVGHSEAAVVFGSKEFFELAGARPAYVESVMRDHPSSNILFADIDAIWLRDPRDFFQTPPYATALSAKNNHGGSTQNEDEMGYIWVQNDARFLYRLLGMPLPCAGFVAFRNNANTLAMVHTWTEIMMTQPWLNDDGWFATKEQMNDQEVLQLISSDYHNKGKVTTIMLPIGAFPNGQSFFEDFSPSQRDAVYVAHNNWVKGADVKRQRFRDLGLWNPLRVGDRF